MKSKDLYGGSMDGLYDVGVVDQGMALQTMMLQSWLESLIKCLGSWLMLAVNLLPIKQIHPMGYFSLRQSVINLLIMMGVQFLPLSNSSLSFRVISNFKLQDMSECLTVSPLILFKFFLNFYIKPNYIIIQFAGQNYIIIPTTNPFHIFIILLMSKTSIIQKITTKNLLAVTVIQTELQRNIELIVQALKLHEKDTKQLHLIVAEHSQKIIDLTKSQTQQASSIKSIQNKAFVAENNQWKNQAIKLKNQIDSLTKRIEQQQNKKQSSEINSVSQSNINSSLNNNQINPQHHNIIEENRNNLTVSLKDFDLQMNKVNDEIKKINKKAQQNMKDQIDHSNQMEKKLEKMIKENDQKIILQLKEVHLDLNKKINDLKLQVEDLTKESKKNIADISKQSSKHQKNKQLEIDFENMKQNINELTENKQKISNEMKSLLQKMNKAIHQQEEDGRLRKKLSDEIWKLNDQLFKLEAEKMERQLSSTDLKSIQKMILDLTNKFNNHLNNHDESKPSNRLKTQTSPEKKNQISSRYDQNYEEGKSPEKDVVDQDFKREMLEKLKGLKHEFMKNMKKIDMMSQGEKQEDRYKLNDLEEKMLRMQHILVGKADVDSMKKLILYLENKLGYIYRIVNVDLNEEDALIAKKNWICLSCDKKLDAYKGKLGHHLINNQLKGKAIDAEVAGGGMLFKSKSKYDLPFVNQAKAKK